MKTSVTTSKNYLEQYRNSINDIKYNKAEPITTTATAT
jgi:hypothetical protein